MQTNPEWQKQKTGYTEKRLGHGRKEHMKGAFHCIIRGMGKLLDIMDPWQWIYTYVMCPNTTWCQYIKLHNFNCVAYCMSATPQKFEKNK